MTVLPSGFELAKKRSRVLVEYSAKFLIMFTYQEFGDSRDEGLAYQILNRAKYPRHFTRGKFAMSSVAKLVATKDIEVGKFTDKDLRELLRLSQLMRRQEKTFRQTVAKIGELGIRVVAQLDHSPSDMENVEFSFMRFK